MLKLYKTCTTDSKGTSNTLAVKRPDIQDEKKASSKSRKTGASGQPAANDAAKFRLYPTDKQYEKIAQTIGCARYYWNLILDLAIITHEQIGYSLVIQPVETKKLKGCEFLNNVDSLALSSVYANYKQAWENHRNNPKHFGKPVHKIRHGLEGSYTTYNQPKWDQEACEYVSPGSIRIEDGKIHLSRVGDVEIRQHYDLPEDAVIKNVTVSRDGAGRVFASIGFFNPELARILEKTGLDAEQEHFIVTGLDYSNPYLFVNECGLSPRDVHFYRESEKKLAKLQRKLSRRQMGSANYKKLRTRIARLHRKIANQRKDLLHKLSHELASKCDIVVVETLDMQAMAKHKNGGRLSFGKSVSDNAWGTFLTYLDYKLRRHYGQLVKVDKWYPSSKKCHHCGALNEDLPLSNRDWTCQECGVNHDRDVNAAWNILLEGIRMLRAGEVEGSSISEDAKIFCADGTSVTANPPMSKIDMGFGVLPVEGYNTKREVFRYCSYNTNLRAGDLDLREAGKETDRSGYAAAVITEAPASTALCAVSRG